MDENGNQVGAAASSDAGHKPRSEAEAEAEAEAVEIPAADADKGKSVAAAADDGKLSFNHIALDPEMRRKRMKGFRALQDVMPHVPRKTDKLTVMGEAIEYIKFLEEKAAMLGMENLEQALSQQAAARGEASSSSSIIPLVMPQNMQGWGDLPLPPAAPVMLAPPVRLRTWTGRNVLVLLTVANNNAYIVVSAPRRAHTLATVMSVLGNSGIDVITTQISSDTADTLLILIFTHVNGTNATNGVNRSAEEVYQRAMSEIMFRLNNSN